MEHTQTQAAKCHWHDLSFASQ